jgi:hypothetical protein
MQIIDLKFSQISDCLRYRISGTLGRPHTEVKWKPTPCDTCTNTQSNQLSNSFLPSAWPQKKNPKEIEAAVFGGRNSSRQKWRRHRANGQPIELVNQRS